MRVCVLALIALLTGGCLREDFVEPTQDSVAVHALARVGDESLHVALSYSSVLFTSHPVQGATVVSRRGDVVTAHEYRRGHPCVAPDNDDGSIACYTIPELPPFVEGESVALEITLPDGTRVVGETTLPERPQVLAPSAGASIERVIVAQPTTSGGDYFLHTEPLQVEWDDGGVEAQVGIDVVALFRDGQRFTECRHGLDRVTRSPARVDVPLCALGIEEVWDSMHAIVNVAAYDAAYREYVAAFNGTSVGVVREHALAGLDVVAGDRIVAGVFGSAAVTQVPIVIHWTIDDRRPSGNRATGAPARAEAARGSGSRPRS